MPLDRRPIGPVLRYLELLGTGGRTGVAGAAIGAAALAAARGASWSALLLALMSAALPVATAIVVLRPISRWLRGAEHAVSFRAGVAEADAADGAVVFDQAMLVRGPAALRRAGRSIAEVLRGERDVAADLRALSAEAERHSEDIFALGKTILLGTESTASAALSAAASADRVSQNMHIVAAAVEELAASVSEVSAHATDAAMTATTAASHATTSAASVQTLADASARVAEVADFIRRIAAQTHLLALNATIEAARAGNSGKGFAVVAGEVKTLATETARATEDVTERVASMLGGSASARQSIRVITEVISTVNDSQAAISSSMLQQTAAAGQIGRIASETATASIEIAQNVADLSTAVRRIAYSGATADTKAGELVAFKDRLDALAHGRTTCGRRADDETGAAGAAARRSGIATRHGVLTRIEDDVTGSGLHQIEYHGSWAHSRANSLVGGTNSYSVMTGDAATLRFEGVQVRVFVVTQHNQGIIAITLDGEVEVFADCYSPERHREVLVYESPVLTRGRHTVRLRNTGTKNPVSTFFWTSLDRFEVLDAVAAV